METLLKYQADVNIQNKEDGKTLLHAFAKSGLRTEFLHMCNRLIELGADPNIQDNEGNTTLHYVQARFQNYSVPNNVLSYFKKYENSIQIDFTRYNKYGVKICIC
jgi:ankyrin repeat protein